MNDKTRTLRVLGLAFLFQFLTSLISSAYILPRASGISTMRAPADVSVILARIAAHPGLMRANILGEMATAMGIIFLGAMLFTVLRNTGEKTALVALGFYVLEAGLLAVSTLEAFSLLRLSEAHLVGGQPESLLAMGKAAVDSTSFAYTLHTLPFAYGAFLFYLLLDKARLVPRALSLWGLISVLPFLIGIPLGLLGLDFPFFFYLPYVPFELVIGAWFLLARSGEGAS